MRPESDNEDLIQELAEELTSFLSSYSSINVNNPDVQTKIEELAEAAVESMADFDEDEDEEFLSYEGNMDKYTGDDDEDT